MAFLWSNHSDIKQPHPKRWLSKQNFSSRKSRLKHHLRSMNLGVRPFRVDTNKRRMDEILRVANSFIQLPWPLDLSDAVLEFPGVMGLPYVWRGYPFKAPKIKAEADDGPAAWVGPYLEPAGSAKTISETYENCVDPIPWHVTYVTFLEWQDLLVESSAY